MHADGEFPLPSPGVALNLKAHFGAAGDGKKDDTAVLERAISIVQKTGGVLYLPPGTYVIERPLTVTRSNVVIRGAGVSWVQIGATRTCMARSRMMCCGAAVCRKAMQAQAALAAPPPPLIPEQHLPLCRRARQPSRS